MTDFNVNTRKTWLKRRINRAWQQLKSLKKKAAWSALLKPNRLRPPRRSHAGAMSLRDTLLTLLIGIALLSGLVCLIISGVQKIL